MRIGMGSLEKLLLIHHYFGSLSKVSRNSVVSVRAMGYGLSMAGRALTGTYLKNAYQTRSSEDFFYARQASVPTRQKGCSSYFGPATASYYGYFLWVLMGTFGFYGF